MTDCQKDMFSIGTAATLLGVRSDTLRYYEKRNLIASRRMDNGYRYYTKDDLERLLCILYYRKMDISISHMPIILENASTSSSIDKLLEEKIQKEEEEIFRHRQNIIRLNMAKIQHERTERLQKGFQIQQFPEARIIGECSSSWDITLLWFQKARELPGLDMAYLYDEYAVSDPVSPCSYQRSLLMFYKDTADALPDSFHLQDYPLMPAVPCVVYSYTGGIDTNIREYVSQMIAWADEHHYQVTGSCFSTRLFSGSAVAESNYENEIYLPVVKR